MIWREGKPPQDGKRYLVFARLNEDDSERGSVVGYWSASNREWRLAVNDAGTELLVDYWAEISELPTVWLDAGSGRRLAITGT